jgi:hypothetical protein
MSINAMEKALWQASTNPADAQRYRDDARAYLKGFKLDKDEHALLASWDVGEAISRGVNPLLLLNAFSVVNGMDKMIEYLMKVNQPRAAAPAE